MPWDYSNKVMQLFRDAIAGKAGTHFGRADPPDGEGRHGSIQCGDAMDFTFQVDRDPEDPRRDRIVTARYQTFGCTSAIASSEALCRMLEDRRLTPIEALRIRNADIVDYLEGLPPQKLHCSVMGAEALQAAVVDWARRRGVPLEELGIDPTQLAEDEGRVVCRCFNLTEPYIRRKVKELNLRTIEEITAAIKAGGACTSCHHEPGGLQDILDETWGARPETAPEPSATPSGTAIGRPARTPYQFAKEVERVVDTIVRPRLALEGGNIEIVEIRDRKVFCRLLGVCAGCPGSSQTLVFVVEDALREHVDPEIEVVPVRMP
ncbi:iron-sulfur cluster assembly scaffold protein [Myxococcota bacterium]|nr:iron-sulfur cluster assembly scaffold protein [Myxococcota bacterium]